MPMDEKYLVYHKEGPKRGKADSEQSLGSELKVILKWYVKGFGGVTFKLPCTDTARNSLTHSMGNIAKIYMVLKLFSKTLEHFSSGYILNDGGN